MQLSRGFPDVFNGVVSRSSESKCKHGLVDLHARSQLNLGFAELLTEGLITKTEEGLVQW